MASDWPLLTGGRYSEVVVRTGLTVLPKIGLGKTVETLNSQICRKYFSKIMI
jgi:hypothetical protein